MGDQATVPVQECISVRLYGPGCGDVVFQDRGWEAYDLLRDCWRQGSFSRDAGGVSQLEYVEEVGLVCRPYATPKDAGAAWWTFGPGTWHEMRALVGAYQPLMIGQWDVAANYWTAATKFQLPANPQIGFLVHLGDVPAATAGTAGDAGIVLLVFGGGAWALQFHPGAGLRLMRWSAAQGLYEVAIEVGEPDRSVGSDVSGYRTILLRCLRGKILLSTDYGRTYTVYSDPAGKDVTVPAGGITVHGCQRTMALGLVEVAHQQGEWTSPLRRTNKSRDTGGMTVTPWQPRTPGGTTVVGIDVSDVVVGNGQDSRAVYRLVLTPEKTKASGAPVQCWATPEAYATLYRYPPVTTDGADTYTTPWDNEVLQVRLSKPYELDQATCTIEGEQDAPFDWGTWVEDPETHNPVHVSQSWKWRRVVVMRGTQAQAGSATMAEWFVGRIWRAKVEEVPDKPGRVGVHLELVGATQRAKRMTWENGIPLGGQTANQALHAILDRVGVPAGKRNLDPAGDLVKLPAGTAESPGFMTRRGDPMWGDFDRIARHAGMEAGCTDVEEWYTVPVRFSEGETAKAWKAPAGGYEELIRSVSCEFDSSESYTAVQVIGRDAAGNPVRAYVDGRDEEDPTSERYSPWPEVYVEEMPDTTSPAAASDRCINLFEEKFPLHWVVEVEATLAAGVYRRDQVQVQGAGVGIGDADTLDVETLEHQVAGVEGESTTRVAGRLK